MFFSSVGQDWIGREGYQDLSRLALCNYCLGIEDALKSKNDHNIAQYTAVFKDDS